MEELKINKKKADEINMQIKYAEMDEDGKEHPDQTPLSIPIGFKKPDRLKETIQRLVRTELSKQAMDNEMETFEEANDFDVQDPFDVDEPATQYTLMEEEDERFVELARAEAEDSKSGADIPPVSDNENSTLLSGTVLDDTDKDEAIKKED